MRRWVYVVAVLALLALAVVIALPSLARRQAEARIASRAGVPAHVDDVVLGWGSMRLLGVRLDGIGVIEMIDVDAGPLDVAIGGLGAISALNVSGCDLELAVPSASEREGTVAHGEAVGSTLPEVEIADCVVRAHDEVGPVFSATIDASGGGDRWSATLRTANLGDGIATAERLEIVATRTNHNWTLLSVSALTPRLRDEVGARDLAARWMGDPEATTEAEPESDADDEPGIVRLALGHTADDFRLEIVDGAIRGDEDAAAVLDDLDLTLQREPGRILTSGAGRPSRGGSFGWDLTVDLDAFRATGSVNLDDVPLAVATTALPELPLLHPQETLVSASVTLASAEASRVVASGSVHVRELAISHSRVSSAPVEHIAFDLDGRATWIPDDRRLLVDELRFGMGDAAINLDGTFEWTNEHYLIDAHVRLPRTRCDAAVHAIPADLLGDLTALQMTGTIGGRLGVHVDSRDLDDTTLEIAVDDRCTFVTVPASADVTRFSAPFLHRVVENDGDEFEMETGPGSAAWAPLSTISPFLVHAVLSHEDASFFRHHGFAPWAIRDALVRNLREGRYAVGASTITMQLAKNVFLHREKTLARKVQEVLLTWWIESVMTKEQILELYLNVIELGPAVYGIRAGAEFWFGRTPAELSVAESAYLACILPNPSVFAEEHRPEGAPPASFRRRMRNLVQHLGESGRIDEEALAVGLAELETLRFARPGVPVAPWTPVGHASALPIEGWSGSVGAFEDEAGWSDPSDPPADADLERYDSPSDDVSALDDTMRGWEER